jgi:hypothetical protein
MKRVLLPVILSLLSLSAQTQNWQMVNSGYERWFKDCDGNLKVIITDSVKSIGTDSIFYFPNTLGAVTHSLSNIRAVFSSPWWTGSHMILTPDSRNLFFNARNDTITLFPLKQLNEEWIMATYPGGNYAKARIISIGTDTIMGNIDSVKVISIRLYSASNNLINAGMNKDIVISKNSGFVTIFPLFSAMDSFKYSDYEWQTEKYKEVNYSLTSNAKRLRYRDVYAFSAGDHIQISNGALLNSVKIKDKTDYGDSIVYKAEFINSSLVGGFHILDSKDSVWKLLNCNRLFAPEYPEQYSASTKREYSYKINSCGLITMIKTYRDIRDTMYNTFEPVTSGVSYTEHLGLVDSFITTTGNVNFHYSLSFSNSSYCHTGTNPAGLSTASRDIFNLSPNPVLNFLHIVSEHEIQKLRVLDAIGRDIELLAAEKNGLECSLDLSNLQPGLYFLILNDEKTFRFVKK